MKNEWTIIEILSMTNFFDSKSTKVPAEDTVLDQFVTAVEMMEKDNKFYNRCEVDTKTFKALAQALKEHIQPPRKSLKGLKTIVFKMGDDMMTVTGLEGHAKNTILFYNYTESLKYEM